MVHKATDKNKAKGKKDNSDIKQAFLETSGLEI